MPKVNKITAATFESTKQVKGVKVTADMRRMCVEVNVSKAQNCFDRQ